MHFCNESEVNTSGLKRLLLMRRGSLLVGLWVEMDYRIVGEWIHRLVALLE